MLILSYLFNFKWKSMIPLYFREYNELIEVHAGCYLTARHSGSLSG